MRLLATLLYCSLLLYSGVRVILNPTGSAGAASVCDSIFQTDLEACWDFIEDSAGIQTITDRIGAHDLLRGPTSGSESRDPAWISGDRLDFTDSTTDEYVDGNGHLTFGTTDLYGDSNTSFTLQLVLIRDSNPEFAVVFGKGGSGSSSVLALEINTFDRVFVRIRGDSTALHFDDNAWHMHTIVCDAGTCTYYLDDGTGTILDNSTSTADLSAEISIGCGDEGSHPDCLDGKVAFGCIYDAALSQANVASNCDTVDTDFNANRSINLPCTA